jgi:hypothetical protein
MDNLNKYDEFKERLVEIKKKLDNWKQLKNNIADNRNKHREFAHNINLDFEILKRTYELYEPNLIISCYTFMEQLVKEFIYKTLNKNENPLEIKNFINQQIPREKFSPDISIKSIKSIISRYIPKENRENTKIKLIWEYIEETEEKNSYSELIKRRHEYAHEGTYYPLEIIDYENFLNLMEYFIYEFELLNYSIKDRMKIHKSLEIISKNMDKLKENCSRSYVKELTKIIREESKKLFKILENIRDKSIIFNKICNKLENLRKIDIRSSTTKIKKRLNDNAIRFK